MLPFFFLKVNSICSGEEDKGWSATESKALVIKNGRPDKEGLGAGVKSGSTEGSHMQLIYGPFRTLMCFKCDLAHTLTLTCFLARLFCHTLRFTHQTQKKFCSEYIRVAKHAYIYNAICLQKHSLDNVGKLKVNKNL